MQKCLHCGAEIADEAAFCPHCGESVVKAQTVICSYCQKVIPANQLFCPYCGHRVIVEPQPEPEPQPIPQPDPHPEPQPIPKSNVETEDPAQIDQKVRVNRIFALGTCVLYVLSEALLSSTIISYRSFSEALLIFTVIGIAVFFGSLIMINQYEKFALLAWNATEPQVRQGYKNKAKQMLNQAYIVILVLMILSFVIAGIDW